MARFLSGSGTGLSAHGDAAEIMRHSPFYREIEEVRAETAIPAAPEAEEAGEADARPDTQPKAKAAQKRKRTANTKD